MSYSTVYGISPGTDVRPVEILELRNSWGSAPVVWSALCTKLFGAERHGWYTWLDKLWARWQDLSLPEHYRAVLMMTYDAAYVERKDYPRAAADIRRFLIDFPVPEDCANHWPTIAGLYESEPDYPGIHIHQTSVCGDIVFEGKFDEETEEYGPPDWSRAYSIYSQLDGLCAGESVLGK